MRSGTGTKSAVGYIHGKKGRGKVHNGTYFEMQFSGVFPPRKLCKITTNIKGATHTAV